MKRRALHAVRAAAALVPVSFATPASATPAVHELAALHAKLNALKQRLAALEAARRAVGRRRAAAGAAAVSGPKPRSWLLPGTRTAIRFGGFARLNLIYDAGGSTGDRSTRSTLPLDGSAAANRQGNVRLNANRSRLWVATWTPTDWGELATYVEGDFTRTIGGDPVFRLRHAYGRLGPVLAGRTNSLFRFNDYYAKVVDTPGVVGEIAPRQGQVRYTHNLGGGTAIAISIEDPQTEDVLTSTAYGGPPIVPSGTDRLPDLVVAVEHVWPNGRARFAALARGLRIDDGAAVSALALGWGVAAAVALRFNRGRNALGVMAHYGEGIGRYLDDGPNDAIVTGTSPADFSLEPVAAYGGFVWFHHRWTDTLSSNVAYGIQIGDAASRVAGKSFVPAGTNRNIWAVHANVFWRPVAAVEFGLEYIFAFRGTVNAPNGKLSRVRLDARYRF